VTDHRDLAACSAWRATMVSTAALDPRDEAGERLEVADVERAGAPRVDHGLERPLTERRIDPAALDHAAQLGARGDHLRQTSGQQLERRVLGQLVDGDRLGQRVAGVGGGADQVRGGVALAAQRAAVDRGGAEAARGPAPAQRLGLRDAAGRQHVVVGGPVRGLTVADQSQGAHAGTLRWRGARLASALEQPVDPRLRDQPASDSACLAPLRAWGRG
jgi:hypothetical protein